MSASGDAPDRDLPPGVSGPPGWLLTVVKDQRVAFLIVGGINTIQGTLWYWVFYALLGPLAGSFGHMVALVPTYAAAIFCAFLLYRKFVFKVKGHFVRDLLRFSTVYLTMFLINIPMLGLLVNVLHLSPYVAQVLNVAVTTVASWVFHNRFSFRRTESELAEQEKTLNA